MPNDEFLKTDTFAIYININYIRYADTEWVILMGYEKGKKKIFIEEPRWTNTVPASTIYSRILPFSLRTILKVVCPSSPGFCL